MIKAFTLGPEGSCHENATRVYLAYLGVLDYELHLLGDMDAAAKEALNHESSIVVQCSAHLNVHLITEHYRDDLPIVDTFIFPTQEMALLKRRGIKEPRSIGLPEPAIGYIRPNDWENIYYESTKPIVTKNLLAGKYDAGIAYTRDAEQHLHELELCEVIGEVVVTWIVYARTRRFSGNLLSTAAPAEILELITGSAGLLRGREIV